MNAKELAAAAALASAGLIAVGIAGHLDEVQKEAFVDDLTAEKNKVVMLERDARRSDGGWLFSADTFAVSLAKTAKGDEAYVMTAGAGSTWVVLDESPCVIPDCSTADGGWDDDHAPVDCVFQYPGESRRWRGCNVGAAVYSSGAACLPSACLESP